MSQEQLAKQLGVTTQAVSKWECDLAYPDIELLMQIADIYGVTIDSLLREQAVEATGVTEPTMQSEIVNPGLTCQNLPDDDTLRIILFKGQRPVEKHALDDGIVIPVTMEQLEKRHWWQKKAVEGENISIQMEIHGHAEIDGDVSGSIHAHGDIHCGDVSGDVHAGANMECGDISGNVKCNGNLSCGDIDGSVESCAGGLESGDIGGSIKSCVGDISCGDIGGSIHSCVGNIECGDIGGSINCAGTVN